MSRRSFSRMLTSRCYVVQVDGGRGAAETDRFVLSEVTVTRWLGRTVARWICVFICVWMVVVKLVVRVAPQQIRSRAEWS